MRRWEFVWLEVIDYRFFFFLCCSFLFMISFVFSWCWMRCFGVLFCSLLCVACTRSLGFPGTTYPDLPGRIALSADCNSWPRLRWCIHCSQKLASTDSFTLIPYVENETQDPNGVRSLLHWWTGVGNPIQHMWPTQWSEGCVSLQPCNSIAYPSSLRPTYCR